MIVNGTPMLESQFMKLTKNGEFCDVVIVSGSFRLDGNRWQLLAQHRPAEAADEYWNEADPLTSSVKRPGDYVVFKPATDVYVTGHAHPPSNDLTANAIEWDAALRIGRGEGTKNVLLNKSLHITGPRFWQRTVLGWALGKPTATRSAPLRYELAYGGWWRKPAVADADEAVVSYPGNPCGSGFMAPSLTAEAAGNPKVLHPPRYGKGEPMPGPQIGYVGDPLDRVNDRYRPAGYGPIARHWEPRVSLTGNYSAKQLAETPARGYNTYPADFDERFFQDAPADQQISPHLQGDEWIDLVGLIAGVPAIRTFLPDFTIRAQLRHEDTTVRLTDMLLDTLHLETGGGGNDNPAEKAQAPRLHLTWRLTLPHADRISAVTLYRRAISDAQLSPAPGFTSIPSVPRDANKILQDILRDKRAESTRDSKP